MLEQPILIPINDKEFELRDDYTYSWPVDDPVERITVKTPFITDIASVPQFAWSLSGMGPDGLYRAAAVVHDFLYQRKGILKAGVYEVMKGGKWTVTLQAKNRKFSRKECDQMFKQMMLEAGVGKFKAELMYRSVRTFGWLAW